MAELGQLIFKNKHRLNFAKQVKTFERRTTILLNYLSTTKNFTKFESVYPEIEQEFEVFKTSINPNFKAFIIFYISKLYFMGDKFEEALNWCEQLSDIQYEMGNLKIIPHLVSSAEYFCKSHSVSLEVEQCFIRGINKIKAFHLEKEKEAMLKKILSEIQLIYKNESEKKVNLLIDIEEWLQSKF